MHLWHLHSHSIAYFFHLFAGSLFCFWGVFWPGGSKCPLSRKLVQKIHPSIEPLLSVSYLPCCSLLWLAPIKEPLQAAQHSTHLQVIKDCNQQIRTIPKLSKCLLGDCHSDAENSNGNKVVLDTARDEWKSCRGSLSQKHHTSWGSPCGGDETMSSVKFQGIGPNTLAGGWWQPQPET